MFERYTEKARRVIFFARYEASQYGSPYIETEHLLLGLMREGHALMRKFLAPNLDINVIRSEIEKSITVRERISTSVEVPLSQESKSVLMFGAEESSIMGSRHIGEEHILLGILRVDKSRAARILKDKGGDLATIRQMAAKPAALPEAGGKLVFAEDGVSKLYKFLARIGSDDKGEFALLLATNARVVDSAGVRWRGRDEIERSAKRIFGPYATQGVTSSVESVEEGPGHTLVASVLWEHLTAEGQPSISSHRMTVVLAPERGSWVVLFLQATPVMAP